VFQRLILNPEFKLRFTDVAQKLMQNGGLLTPESAAAVYQARMQEIDRAIVGESARWGDNHTTAADPPGAGNPYLRTHWVARQDDLLTNYFPGRTGIVLGQFTTRGWNVPLAAPLYSQFGGTVAAGYALTLAKPAGSPAAASIYYTLDGMDPRDPATNLPRSSAILYTGGSIVIDVGKRVQARIYQDLGGSSVNEWSPLDDATFVLETPFPLRITELNYNPAPYAGVSDSQDLEYFELTNTGAQSISLNGVQIAEFATTPYEFPSGLMLAAGERIIVARTPATFQFAYGNAYNVSPTGYAAANLSNGGESVKLLGPVGETLQEFAYSDAPSWPTTPDGGGKTLEIINPLGDPSSPANWRASFYRGGSPGTAGVAPASPGDFDADADVDGADFLAWQRGLGTQALKASAAQGDADGDRDVDAADLGLWTGNFGATPVIAAAATASTPALSAAAVPAVSSAVLAPTVLADDEWILSLAASPTASNSKSPRRDREHTIDQLLADSSAPLARSAWRPPHSSERAARREPLTSAQTTDAAARDEALAVDLVIAWDGLPHGLA
jgi:hypothetical protein